MNSARNITGLFVLAIALVLYVAGITTPFMAFEIHFKMDDMANIPFIGGLLGGLEEKMNKTITYTIFEAIEALLKNGQLFVAFLLGFFGVVIPIIKTLLTLVMLLFYKRKFAHGLHRVINFMGKFAMADVFTVGIFIAFLYTKFDQPIKANIRDGYYYFAGYCLLSIIANLLIRLPKKEVERG
jgi:hypothetical protein